MQKLGDKLVAAGVAKPPRRTTFPDGRMVTTEAYIYYKERCRDRGMDFISKMMFKWHLKHGQYLQSEFVSNPFGRYPARIYAISMDGILNFVEELAQREDTLTLQRQGNVIRRTTKDRVKRSSTPSEPESKLPDPPASTSISPQEPKLQGSMIESSSDDGETVMKTPPSEDTTMDTSHAFEYLSKKAGHKSALNRTMFGFYLAYELIDSTFEGRGRRVDPESIDAFLALCPSGLYKQHIDYVVKEKLGKDDLTMRDAYFYYVTLDPNPVTKNSFRALVAAGVIVAIRSENKSSSRTIGFKRTEIEHFAKLRKHIAEKNAEAPTTRGFRNRKAKAKPSCPKADITQDDTDSLDSDLQGTQDQGDALVATQAAAIKARNEDPENDDPEKEDREWVSIKVAYLYYVERVDEPYSRTWFASKCYKNDPFEAVCKNDKRYNNPTGKKYTVNLDSVDTYLESNADTRATNLSFPLDKAYHKFRDLMPAGLSLIQFKRLVRNKVIKSFTRDGVSRVRYGDVGIYFKDHEDVVPVEDFKMKDRNIDAEASKKKPESKKRVSSRSDDRGDEPYVTLSMSKFPTKEGLAAAIEALQTQGIRVEIEP